MPKKILAASWYPGAINAIIPVIQRLQVENKVQVVVFGHRYSEKILAARNVHYKTLGDYGLPDVSLLSMARLLEQESPDLILTGTSAQDVGEPDALEQNLALAARPADIPTLAVLDFWSQYSVRFDDIFTAERQKYLPTKIAVMDQYAVEAMVDEGFDQSRLVNTGNPHFDALPVIARSFTEEEKKIVRKRIGLSAEVLCFYAAQSCRKNEDRCGRLTIASLRIINEVLQQFPERERGRYGLVVKLHPRVPEEERRQVEFYIAAHGQSRMALVNDIDPQKLVLASDFTTTPFSTLGIEAIYLGKPCLFLHPDGCPEQFLITLARQGIVPLGETPAECASLVQRAFVDERYRQQELLQQAASFRTDGKATERVMSLVYRMLKA